jgi:hypothetical protein
VASKGGVSLQEASRREKMAKREGQSHSYDSYCAGDIVSICVQYVPSGPVEKSDSRPKRTPFKATSSEAR